MRFPGGSRLYAANPDSGRHNHREDAPHFKRDVFSDNRKIRDFPDNWKNHPKIENSIKNKFNFGVKSFKPDAQETTHWTGAWKIFVLETF